MKRTALARAGWCLALLLAAASRAHAFGGLELSPGGARSLARGGANVARAEDGFSVLQNPAGLAALQGDSFMLNVDTAFHSMCVTPYGYYGWGEYTTGKSDFGDTASAKYQNDPLDRVCNSAAVAAVPGIAYTLKLNDDLGLGFGMLAPTGLPGLQYGGADGTIDTPDGARPTPTRYQLVRQRVTFVLGPSVAVGYRVLPRVRVGMTFTWIAVASELSIVQALAIGTSPHSDMLATLKAHDYFIPAATFGVLASPLDMLDVGLTFRIVDSFNGTGQLQYTTNTFQQSSASGYVAYKNDAIKLTRVKTGVPWLLTGGVRYASPVPSAPRDAKGMLLRGDPLTQEQFDVELDGAFQMNTPTNSSHVSFAPGEIIFQKSDGTSDPPIKVPDPDVNDFSSSRHAENAFTVRLGATYNLLPGVVGVSAGGFYESRSVDPAYASIDTFGFARVGFGVGAMARAGSWDFALGLGHVFQETLFVGTPPQQSFQSATTDPTTGFDKRVNIDAGGNGGTVKQEPNPPAHPDGVARLQQSAVYTFKGQHARVVNAGVYRASFNILAINISHRF